MQDEHGKGTRKFVKQFETVQRTAAQFETVQRTAAKNVLGCSSTTSNTVLRAELVCIHLKKIERMAIQSK